MPGESPGVESMDAEKDKNKNDFNPPGGDKRKVSPSPKEEKDTRLAKRSGQRPAPLFKRKPPA